MNITSAVVMFEPKVPLSTEKIIESGQFYRIRRSGGLTVIYLSETRKEVLILFRRNTKVIAILNGINHADEQIRSFCKRAVKRLYRASGVRRLRGFNNYTVKNYVCRIFTDEYPETFMCRTSNGGKVRFFEGKVVFITKCKTPAALAAAWEEGKARYSDLNRINQ